MSVACDWAAVRVVPDARTGTWATVGVILQARTRRFVAMRCMTEPASLRLRVPTLDATDLARALDAWQRTCAGDPAAAPIALLSPSQRFHWLTAPRSAILRCGPIHGAFGEPEAVLEQLYRSHSGWLRRH